MGDKETRLNRPLAGLLLMTVFTTVWAIIAEYYFNTSAYRVSSISFGIIISIIIFYFIYSYWTLSRQKKNLSETEDIEHPTKEKAYWIILVITGIAIFLANTLLLNLGESNLFTSCFALIVGLHFIPLARVFDRKFDYYIGIWTILASTIGLVLIIQQDLDYRIINAFVCVACAISTISCAMNMISNGKKILISI